ncbi:MAG: hypothetical protein ACI936_000445 [Paraglaciecola sp.]|jgi:hypothetical protein
MPIIDKFLKNIPRKWIVILVALVFIVLLIFLRTSTETDSPESDVNKIGLRDHVAEVVDVNAPKILIGKWMGGLGACSAEYDINTQYFELAQGSYNTYGSKIKERMVQLQLDDDDVPEHIMNYAKNCQAIDLDENDDWFKLTFKRYTEDKEFYWYGDVNSELPEQASGVLILDGDTLVLFEPYDLSKIKRLADKAQ